MKSVNLIFAHQLFKNHEIYSNGFPIYLIEEYLFFKAFNFHKQKIAFHRASMKYHENFLREKGCTVNYIDAQNDLADIRKLIPALAEKNIQSIHYINQTDNWLEKRIQQKSKEYNLQLTEYENPIFINSRSDLSPFFKPDKKSFFQTSFYKQQRTRLNLLMENSDQPLGGKWSFDQDNRKKYPKDKSAPIVEFPKSDQYWEEALAYVRQHFDKNPGELSSDPIYPFHVKEAEKWFNQFLKFRFHEFGDFEDAIVEKESILHHSVLSPMLNTGILLPLEVVNRAIEYAEEHAVPLNSLEGFVRQIIGWREFIRGMYECKGSESRNRNFWGFERKIPDSFYDGSTGIVPVDQTIKKVLRDGYCHHIERLMVLGNFMLLCEFHPREVYRWFMELFIDAYDWVMVPNVYGMSQFADGGFFATKPYISGSNYLMKMSDYKKGEWQKIWDGLFWRFLHINRDFFLKNPRLSMLVRTFDKMDAEKQKTLLDNANAFLEKLDA